MTTLMICVESGNRAAAVARIRCPRLLRAAAEEALHEAQERVEHAALIGPEMQHAAVQQAEHLEKILGRIVTKRCRRPTKENDR